MKPKHHQPIQLSYLTILLINSTALLFFCLSSIAQQKKIVTNSKLLMLSACEKFIDSYKPVYYCNSDTFLVARFKTPPDSLNEFLFNCAIEKDYEPLKYSLALVIRHFKEYSKKNKQDYLISDGLIIGKNGFITLLRSAMGLGEVSDSNLSVDYFPFFTGDIWDWANKEKNKIKDFNYLEGYRKRRF